MKKELDDKLCRDFPNLFRDRTAPKNQTCMYWGFCVGEGWYDLVYNLSAKLEKLILQQPEKDRILFRASQVKEKFGGLRFYMTCSTSEMEYHIEKAECESFKICEECGSRFLVRRTLGGWVVSLCTIHRWKYYFKKCDWKRIPFVYIKMKWYKLVDKIGEWKEYLNNLFHGF